MLASQYVQTRHYGQSQCGPSLGITGSHRTARLYPNDGLRWLQKPTFPLLANLDGKHNKGKILLSQTTLAVALIFFLLNFQTPGQELLCPHAQQDGHPGSGADPVPPDSSLPSQGWPPWSRLCPSLMFAPTS